MPITGLGIHTGPASIESQSVNYTLDTDHAQTCRWQVLKRRIRAIDQRVRRQHQSGSPGLSFYEIPPVLVPQMPTFDLTFPLPFAAKISAA